MSIKTISYIGILVVTSIFFGCSNKDTFDCVSNIDKRLKEIEIQPFYKSNYINIVKLSEQDKIFAKCILKYIGIKEFIPSFENINTIFNYVNGLESKQDIPNVDLNQKPTSKINGRDAGLRFPLNTFRDRGGDCEDKTALVVMLFEEIGVPTIIFKKEKELGQKLGHIYCGIKFDTVVGHEKELAAGFKTFSPENSDVKWLPIETTTNVKVTIGTFNKINDPKGLTYQEILDELDNNNGKLFNIFVFILLCIVVFILAKKFHFSNLLSKK